MSGFITAHLNEILTKKQFVEQELETVEQRIYDLETSYFEDTNNGNILQGWDLYLSAQPRTMTATKKQIRDSDRIFSMSSTTAPHVRTYFPFLTRQIAEYEEPERKLGQKFDGDRGKGKNKSMKKAKVLNGRDKKSKAQQSSSSDDDSS